MSDYNEAYGYGEYPSTFQVDSAKNLGCWPQLSDGKYPLSKGGYANQDKMIYDGAWKNYYTDARKVDYGEPPYDYDLAERSKALVHYDQALDENQIPEELDPEPESVPVAEEALGNGSAQMNLILLGLLIALVAFKFFNPKFPLPAVYIVGGLLVLVLLFNLSQQLLFIPGGG